MGRVRRRSLSVLPHPERCGCTSPCEGVWTTTSTGYACGGFFVLKECLACRYCSRVSVVRSCVFVEWTRLVCLVGFLPRIVGESRVRQGDILPRPVEAGASCSRPRCAGSGSTGYPHMPYGSHVLTNRACSMILLPSSRTFMPALVSRSCHVPHSGQTHSRMDMSLTCGFRYPQSLHS